MTDYRHVSLAGDRCSFKGSSTSSSFWTSMLSLEVLFARLFTPTFTELSEFALFIAFSYVFFF